MELATGIQSEIPWKQTIINLNSSLKAIISLELSLTLQIHGVDKHDFEPKI